MVKSNSLKLGGALLCLLISLTIVSTPILTVNAEYLPDPGGKAMFYGSTAYDMYGPEIEAVQYVIGYVDDYFGSEGYVCTNAYGSDTQVENVLQWAYDREHDSHRVALFHHGHGGMQEWSPHCNYPDNDGDPVWDYEIYPQTGLGKHFFVVIWTCMSANEIGGWGPDGALGMPHAWHHTDELSSDGPYCFIGFYNASMPLTQKSTHNPHVEYSEFVIHFYYYALKQDLCIIDALDQISADLWQRGYYQTELHIRFLADWHIEELEPGYGWMKIYGNKWIHLNQYEFTVLAKDQYGNYFANRDVYIDIMHNLADTGSTIDITEGHHTVFVNDFWEPGYTWNRYTFQYYTYGSTKYYLNPTSWNFYEDWTVTANFKKTHCPGDVDGDGDVDQHDWNNFTCAYPSERGDPNWDSRCDFNSDGDVDYEDKTSLLNVIPIYHDVATGSVYLHNNQYYQCQVPFYIDGQEVGPTWYTYQVSEGYHTFAVPQVAWGGLGFAVVFQYWVVMGFPGPSDNPIGFTVQGDVFLGAVYKVIPW